MENKFKVLNSDNKKWLQGTHEHARHFEGALFADTHWGLQIFFQPEKKVVVPEQIIQVQTQVSESTPTFSAALSKLGDLIENSSESLIRENIELSSENWTNLVVSSEVLKLQESINTKSQCLSFFVGVHQKSDSHELDDKESELLNNMAKAMKLSAEEYELLGFPAHYFDREDLHVSSVEEDLELKSLLAKILVQKPSMVFSLGANFTYFFLKRKEKLSLTHGNVIELRFVSENKELLFSTKVMPLFHPELLIINPNMKRTTWIDLQKAMSFIGKN